MRIRIRTRLSRTQAAEIVRRLPAMLAGRAVDNSGLARGVQLRTGMTFLSLVKQAFVVKARGGTDEASIQWAPLAESTIENRLRKRGLKTSRARAIKQLKAAYRATAKSGKRVKQLAAAKAKFAKVLEAAGSIEIGRDTGRMFNSLSPATTAPSGPDQIFDMRPGSVLVGTNVNDDGFYYAEAFHAGMAKQPARPLWPEPDAWPATWWDQVLGAAASGIVMGLTTALGGQAPSDDMRYWPPRA